MNKVEQIIKLAECIHDDYCEGPYGEEPCDCWVDEVRQEVAAALDEARAEGKQTATAEVRAIIEAELQEAEKRGAERERWECHLIAASELDYCGSGSEDFCPRCGSHIADAISARGPMRGPEEE
jgi:hypothetical protein